MAGTSVIIATSGRTDSLRETLRSLRGVRLPAGREIELILVENVSQAGGEAALAELDGSGFRRKYLFEPERGKSRALNRALGVARGDILVFTDDDVRFPADWIERLCAPILAGQADAVAGGVRLAPHLLRPWMNRTHRAWLASTADYLSPNDPSEMCGANMVIRRTALETVGAFDTAIGPGITGGGEESLLSWQLKAAGFRVVGALDVELEHHPNPDRLQYANWLRAARLKGETRAYQLHHWHHAELRNPSLMAGYLRAKLVMRRFLAGRRRPTDEGIPPWELSYVEDLGKFERYLLERKLPRKYEKQGPRGVVPKAVCQKNDWDR